MLNFFFKEGLPLFEVINCQSFLKLISDILKGAKDFPCFAFGNFLASK